MFTFSELKFSVIWFSYQHGIKLVFCIYIVSAFSFAPGTYYAAVMENRADFEGKVVVDVGAGSGILSLFAAQVRSKLLHWFFDFCHFVSDNITGAVCHVNVRLVPNMSMQLRHLKWLNMPNGLFLGTHRLGNESRFVLYQLDSICSFSVFPLTLLKLYIPLF